MNESVHSWDGRQEYVQILSDLIRVYLDCDFRKVEAWHESLRDLVDFVSCRVDPDAEEIYLAKLDEIDRLIHEKVGEAQLKANLEKAYVMIRQLFRLCNRAIADSGLWGIVHKKVHPEEAVEDIF